MQIPLYQIDAFAARPFEGNPAAVCPLEKWLPDEVMQAVAAENNLSETAFFVPTRDGFHIRWFTPASEVDLCGHATLASAHVLFDHLGHEEGEIVFASRSGPLRVRKDGAHLVMDFPAQPATPCDTPPAIVRAFGRQPRECLKSEDYLVVFEDASDVRAAQPDFAALTELDLRGVIITAPSSHHDFVARFFAPKLAVPEDPVTGSAYTQLAPYWADRLGKQKFCARQLSRRGGEVTCEVVGDRVFIAGTAVPYLRGHIEIPLPAGGDVKT